MSTQCHLQNKYCHSVTVTTQLIKLILGCDDTCTARPKEGPIFAKCKEGTMPVTLCKNLYKPKREKKLAIQPLIIGSSHSNTIPCK